MYTVDEVGFQPYGAEVKAQKADAHCTLWQEAVRKWETDKAKTKAKNTLIDKRNKAAEKTWKTTQAAAKQVKKACKDCQ